MQDEVLLLRRIIEQNDKIEELEKNLKSQTSANWKFVQILTTICGNGTMNARFDNIRDFQRGEWHVYSYYFKMLKVFVPDLVEKHPEFEVIAIKMNDWGEAIRESAKAGEND